MKSTEGLYEYGKLIRYIEGDESLERSPIKYFTSVTDKHHVIVQGDTLQLIAQRYYDSNFPWFIIADVNPNIEDIFQLTVGSTILIPDLNLVYGSYG